MIRSAPPSRVSALAPDPGSISGTGGGMAPASPAVPISNKISPANFSIVNFGPFLGVKAGPYGGTFAAKINGTGNFLVLQGISRATEIVIGKRTPTAGSESHLL
jgi:hypothetical protein